MLLKDKGVLDSTLLKIAAKVLRNHTPSVKGYKVKTLKGVVVITYDELIQYISQMADEMSKGNYGQLRKCASCGNFDHPSTLGGRGCCFPKKFTSFRRTDDYCSLWTPMTPEQEYNRRKVHEFGSLQTKRAGDGSEDSKKSN